jgi:hypothetical protein
LKVKSHPGERLEMDAKLKAQPGPQGSAPRNTDAADSTNINRANLTYTALRNTDPPFGSSAAARAGDYKTQTPETAETGSARAKGYLATNTPNVATTASGKTNLACTVFRDMAPPFKIAAPGRGGLGMQHEGIGYELRTNQCPCRKSSPTGY